jgi:hypothetical protein
MVVSAKLPEIFEMNDTSEFSVTAVPRLPRPVLLYADD